MERELTTMENIAKYNNVPIHDIRELFKGAVTMRTLYRRLERWEGYNLKPFEAPFIRAFTYFKSGSGKHSCIRGRSSKEVLEALSFRLAIPIERGNDAPRGGKLGEYVIFSYRWLMKAIEDYLKEDHE